MPPALKGGRPVSDLAIAEKDDAAGSQNQQAVREARPSLQASAIQTSTTQSIVLREPVRSGQSVIFPEGDVTVVGSVASGAEIIAGGSIHIYGTLRGRAMAGSIGNASARIFLPETRGRADSDRWHLQDGRRHDPQPSRASRPAMARRRHDHGRETYLGRKPAKDRRARWGKSS